MKLYIRYIGALYLKFFFIVFFALEFFYVTIDILTNLKDIPKSANLKLIYILFDILGAINYTLPLSLIFATIIVNFNMIRSNELVSFYSLGISKNSLIIPQFIISFSIIIFYIFLNCTQFAYAHKFQKDILNYESIKSPTSDMLLKFDNKYIYISKLNSQNKTAGDIKIFDVQNQDLNNIIQAKRGKYNNIWELEDIQKIQFPSKFDVTQQGYVITNQKKTQELKDFDPRVIDRVYNSSNLYSIKDAIKSIIIFKKEGINIQNIKATLYSMVFFPLFAPITVLILYYFLPLTGRFFNLALSCFLFVLATLFLWGILFLLIRFSLNGVIIPEIGIIMPVFLLSFFGIFLFLKHR